MIHRDASTRRIAVQKTSDRRLTGSSLQGSLNQTARAVKIFFEPHTRLNPEGPLPRPSPGNGRGREAGDPLTGHQYGFDENVPTMNALKGLTLRADFCPDYSRPSIDFQWFYWYFLLS
jgi:hypothetical protein